jgi:hypothetical protein
MSRPETRRFSWLRLLAHVFEFGAAELPLRHRWLAPLAVFPGRDGLPRSLGSVLGAAVARFLPHGFCRQRSGFETVLPKLKLAGLAAGPGSDTVLIAYLDTARTPATSVVASLRWTGTELAPQANMEANFDRMCLADDNTAYGTLVVYQSSRRPGAMYIFDGDLTGLTRN